MRLSNEYDVLIIGGGPAGLAAGLYAGRSMLKTRLFEKELIGGQASITDIIENYPGFPEGITGFELAEKMREQAQKFDVELDMNEVTSVDLIGALKKVTTPDGEYTAKAIIIASGVRPTKLDVPGAAALTGRGISYCATCDGPFFRDKRVMVIGGGNSAVEEAIYLTKFASKVTIVHRRDQLRAEKIVQDRAFKNEKVDFLLDSVLSGVSGENSVSAVTVKNVKTGEEKEVGVEGIFVFVGNIPNTELFTGALDMDEVGYVITDDALMASIPGIFAAGDVRKNNLKQVVWAAAEGALAAVSAEKFIETQG
ncbi:MAG: thioredoxin-disulfide reductase [Candidatus Aquicultor primus]|uniref:Thioredoxin reductase n=1 Tax=Candidatus Aquicultor primus TaxID=1797195 RepID=A0A1F2UP34_9ACTN|nr:MAG: thioredoxin-disulfide reductase [Candidatus Aquicultor primus]